MVVAFLLAAPELGLETFALSVGFLGWEFALLRLGGALLIAILAGFLLGSLARTRVDGDEPAPSIEIDPGRAGDFGSLVRRFRGSFDQLLHHVGAWMVLGIIAAAFVQALVPTEAVASVDPLVELGIVTVLSIPTYICAPSATPLAAVLIAKGISPGAVLVGLLLGPATNLGALYLLKTSYGVRTLLFAVLVIIFVSWGLAYAVNAWFIMPELTSIGPGAAHDHSWLSQLAALLLLFLLLRSMWRCGTRAWLGSVFQIAKPQPGTHSHSHAHRV
jgi:uncharacterized membrane protein YraQ (UPF0718 family)